MRTNLRQGCRGEEARHIRVPQKDVRCQGSVGCGKVRPLVNVRRKEGG